MNEFINSKINLYFYYLESLNMIDTKIEYIYYKK